MFIKKKLMSNTAGCGADKTKFVCFLIYYGAKLKHLNFDTNHAFQYDPTKGKT